MTLASTTSPIKASLIKKGNQSILPMPSPSIPMSVISTRIIWFFSYKVFSFFFIHHSLIYIKLRVTPLYYSIRVIRTFDSNKRLNPSQSVCSVFSNNSVNVCILASVLAAKLSATASIIAGFFGEPYSNSP